MQRVYSTIQRGLIESVVTVGTMLGGLAAKQEYDYLSWYGPGSGGSTVIAELRWEEDGSVRFERSGHKHHLAPGSSPERILVHWQGFCDVAREEYQKETTRC